MMRVVKQQMLLLPSSATLLVPAQCSVVQPYVAVGRWTCWYTNSLWYYSESAQYFRGSWVSAGEPLVHRTPANFLYRLTCSCVKSGAQLLSRHLIGCP